jgi:hypothetical protein
MAKPDLEHELRTLRAEQATTRRNEVFGGLSPAERADYNQKSDRIHALESEIFANSVATASSGSAKAEQRRSWNKQSETDTARGGARQSYRSRESDSTGDSTDSSTGQAKVKRTSKDRDA